MKDDSTRARVSPRPLWIGVAVLWLIPVPAGAQQAAFVQAFSELTTAIEGTYGDEGVRVTPALERMSRALAEWDREIGATAAGGRASANDQQPASVDRRMSLARMYASRGRLAEALSELDAISHLPIRRSDVQVLRGLVLQASGRHTESIDAFRIAQSVNPSDPVVAYYLFHEAEIGRDTKTARDAAAVLAAALPALMKTSGQKGAPFERIALLPAAGKPPLLPLATYSEAFRHMARREYESAIAEFRKAISTDPLVIDPAAGSEPITRAVTALREGRFADARAQIERSGALANSSEAHRVLGLIYWADSAFDKSVAELTEAIRRSPRNERARLALSRVLSTAGRDSDAERALQETLRELPESALARWWLASSYERANRFADAREESERVAAAALAGESQLYGSVGRLASAAADFPGAIDALTRAVRANPNDPTMHKFLAAALVLQDRSEEAFAEFVAVLLIDPGDADAYVGIGQIHLSAGRTMEAVNVLRRATDMAPANGEARYALARALVHIGRADEAAQHFARVEQEQRRTLADRRRTLSTALMKEEAFLREAEGNVEAAIALYEKVVAVTPEPLLYGRLADLYAKVGRALDAARARAMYEKAVQSSPDAGGAR